MKAWKKELLKPWWNKYPDYLPLGAKYRGLWQKRTVKRIIKELDTRKLDMEVATKVFGRKIEIIEVTEYHEYGGQTEYPQIGFKIFDPEYVPGDNDPFIEEKELPNYSTDIKDAFLIVNQLIKTYNQVNINAQRYLAIDNTEGSSYSCAINQHGWLGKQNRAYRTGKTTEEAICLAALQAVEHENK